MTKKIHSRLRREQLPVPSLISGFLNRTALFYNLVIRHKDSLPSMISMSMKMLFPEKKSNLYLKHHAQSSTSHRLTYGQDSQDLHDGATHLISCQSC